MKIESDMIPDKISIPKNLAPHLTEEWASHTHGSLDEYIRKDALLEWANGMMDCFAPGGDCSQTLQMVIKHIESL